MKLPQGHSVPPEIWALGASAVQEVYRGRMRRVLKGAEWAAALCLLAAVLTGVVLVGGVMAAYITATQAGTDPKVAMAAIGGVMVLVTALCIIAARTSLRHITRHRASIVEEANSVVDAFLKGFLS